MDIVEPDSGGRRGALDMPAPDGKRTARIKRPITGTTVEALEPAEKSYIAWDDRLTGFGVRVLPTGTKSFILNYRPGGGGRKAPNRRIVLGRCEKTTAGEARRMAEETLARVAAGEDPAAERARARVVPTLAEAFESYMEAGSHRKASTVAQYRNLVRCYLSDWLSRPLDAITEGDVETRFRRLSGEAGWKAANSAISLLRAVCRQPCAEIGGLQNPVDRWRTDGGRYNRPVSRRIPPPAEVLPRWRVGIERGVRNPVSRDALHFGLYSGMRRSEVIQLRWERVDMAALTFRVDDPGREAPLELPIARQLGAILERRLALRERGPERTRPWVFPSDRGPSGRIASIQHLNARIGEEGGARFWFDALRTCFLAVAEDELMLPRSLTRRLVTHSRPFRGVGSADADWTIEELRESAQRIADRIDELAHNLLVCQRAAATNSLPSDFVDAVQE